MKKGEVNIKPLVYFVSFILGLIFICIIGITRANALVINYNFMGQTVGNSFWLNPNTTNTAHTYATVTENSALKYLIVDVCASIDNLSNFQPLSSVPFKFYKLYDLNTTGTVSGYTCKNARLVYEITQWDDVGNGYFGVNNGSLQIKNNSSYYVEARIDSFGFSDSIDLGDLTVNNQNIIINGIDNIQSSITDTENNINSNIQSSENNINQNIDDMEQSIVDSNKETQEVIKDQFNDCRDSYNMVNPVGVSKTQNGITFTNEGNGVYSLTGTSTATTAFGVTNLSNYPIVLENGKTYTQKIFMLEGNFNFYITTAIRKPDGTTQYDYIVNNQTRTQTFTGNITTYNIYIPSGVTLNAKFKIQLQEGNIATSYEEYGKEICSNKIDETNDKLDNLQGALTDSSPTDMSVLGDTAGWLPPGPVDSIINLPLTFFLNLSQSLSSECRPVSLPLPYVNKNIELPCMYSIYEKIGITGIGGFLTWVGLICSAVMLFNYLLDLYHWVDKTLTMRENTMPGYYEDKWGGGA